MSEQKPFYEIERPTRTTECVIRLIEVSALMETNPCMHVFKANQKHIHAFQCGLDATETCEFCGAWICDLHWSEKSYWTDDRNPTLEHIACEQCARLPKDDLLQVRALRLELNKA